VITHGVVTRKGVPSVGNTFKSILLQWLNQEGWGGQDM